jgi:hypothetical protein
MYTHVVNTAAMELSAIRPFVIQAMDRFRALTGDDAVRARQVRLINSLHFSIFLCKRRHVPETCRAWAQMYMLAYAHTHALTYVRMHTLTHAHMHTRTQAHVPVK